MKLKSFRMETYMEEKEKIMNERDELENLKGQIGGNADLLQLWKEAEDCLNRGDYDKCQKIIDELKEKIAKKKVRGPKP